MQTVSTQNCAHQTILSEKVQFIESLEAAKGKKWEHHENVSIREDVLCLTGFFNGDPWV